MAGGVLMNPFREAQAFKVECLAQIQSIHDKLNACKGRPIMTRVYLKQMADLEKQVRAAEKVERMYVG